VEIYDTRTLAGVISVQKPPILYWLDWFPTVMTFDTMDIMWDVIAPTQRLAPFVAPNVQGRIMRRQGYSDKVFRPAYSKPKHVVDPSQTLARMAGEAIATGSFSLQQRYLAIVAENMRLEKELLMRRYEWMAARAIIDGEVTVTGDDYPTKTVIFGRDASLTTTLLTTTRWNQSTSTPLADLAAARRSSFRLANTTIRRLTFGLNAWDSFSSHADIRPLLSTLVRGSTTEFNIAVPDGAPYEYMGFIAGQGGMGRLDLFTYAAEYEDDNSVLQPFMDADTVVGTGPGIQGVQCYGAIRDFDAGLVATQMFSKMWREQDPSVAFTMTQSAPLMVPAQPNGCFRIKVQ